MFREQPHLSLIQEAGNCMNTRCEIDEEIHDGDVLEFGNTKVEFFLAPGHTEGSGSSED